MSSGRSEKALPDGTVCVWECVEMGERNTVRQQPGYDGLCNYAQKITSCFGLDGKRGERWRKKREAGGGSSRVDEDGETAEALRMCVLRFMRSGDFLLRRDTSLVFLSVLSCECVGCSCSKATTEWMTIGGQYLIAAEYCVLSSSQVHVSMRGCKVGLAYTSLSHFFFSL